MRFIRAAAMAALSAPLSSPFVARAEEALTRPGADARRRLSSATATATVSYPPEADRSVPLVNPERGFYAQFTYRASSDRTRLDVAALEGLRREGTGRSVILRLFYLDAFLDGPIGSDVLDDVEADFGTMRAAG